ncbi:MAG TPA: hypothetical protein VFN75_08710 [Pseudonocardiaceae bacterium]|nr:hypothetical protein [Pseudonocardiaceae bacterium]
MVPTDLAGAIWAEAQAPSAEDFDAVVDGLITEFNQLPAWVVIEHVVLACQQLLAAGRQDDLGRATEAMARMRLREMSPDTGGESRSVEGPSAGHQ